MALFGEEGWLSLTPAFRHDVETRLLMSRHGRVEETSFPPSAQYAAEIGYFSECIRTDRQPEPSGIEGLQDVRTVEAIYRSGRDGRPVTLPRLARLETAAATPETETRKLDTVKRHAS
jgi:glucose-fructose oxidoreductase